MVVDYKELIRQRIMNERDFMRATFSGHQQKTSVPWIRVVLRPVLVKEERLVQFCFFDAQKGITKNYSGAEVSRHLDELLKQPFKDYHVATISEDVQVTISKKGKALIKRSKVQRSPEALNFSHDRQKKLALSRTRPDPYLQAVGIMTADGKIKAGKQKKFKQLNEFLKLIHQTMDSEKLDQPFLNIVDYGCGNAYLTFAVYHYLNHVLGIPTRLTGVDVRPEPLAAHIEKVQSLGWTDLKFEASAIRDFKPATPPDITLALHACDTATDEALAEGIRHRSKMIFSVPCCHHNLQEQLSKQKSPAVFRSVLRHGILKERLGDVLTDNFRALVLRLMGYQTEVLQFVSAEHTAKNIMIRAVRNDTMPGPQLAREYQDLKDYWNVTPYLESLLGESFAAKLRELEESYASKA